ncbi:MAG: hypothetical protein M0R03_12775 [Novosphingobium sp.]|nr:hypothetical protein [Novosphingobium sp.]
MKQRKYLPTLAFLIDRLSIVTLKSIKIPEHKEEYEKEANNIMEDLKTLCEKQKINDFGLLIRAVQANAIINEMIWSNESGARSGKKQDLKKLKLTHSMNRIRNHSMNVISVIFGERQDLKLDYMDSEVTKEFGYDFEKIP